MIVYTPPIVTGGGDLYDGSLDFDGTLSPLGMAASSSVYTLTQNVVADVVTVRSGIRLKPNGYVIYARKLIVESGAWISFNGNDASGATAGASFLAANTNHLGLAAGAGGNGATQAANGTSNGSNGAGSGGNSIGGIGGAGGAAATGTGGTGNASAALAASQFRWWRTPNAAVSMWRTPATGNTVATIQINGGGGGGGGASNMTGGAGTVVGGGGGGAAGIVAISCGILDCRGSIDAIGGGGAAGVTTGTAAGNAGGGGGGAGGAVHVVAFSLASTPTLRAHGGTGGAAVGTGVAGFRGGPGTVCLFVNGAAY